MVEGGAQVAASVLSSDVWDEVHVLTAPTELGFRIEGPSLAQRSSCGDSDLGSDMLRTFGTRAK